MPTVEEQHALAGVRVLDLTGSVAGAVAGMLLADLGADVLKVHPPESGPRVSQRGLVMWDRGKRAAAADPSSADDLLVLDQLIATADVLLVGTSVLLGSHAALPARRDAVAGRPGIGRPAVRLAWPCLEPVVVRGRPR